MVLIHSKEHAILYPEQCFEINFFFPDYQIIFIVKAPTP